MLIWAIKGITLAYDQKNDTKVPSSSTHSVIPAQPRVPLPLYHTEIKGMRH